MLERFNDPPIAAKFISWNQRTHFPIGTKVLLWLAPTDKFHQISTQTYAEENLLGRNFHLENLENQLLSWKTLLNSQSQFYCMKQIFKQIWYSIRVEFRERNVWRRSQVTRCLHCTHYQLSRFGVTHGTYKQVCCWATIFFYFYFILFIFIQNKIK